MKNWSILIIPIDKDSESRQKRFLTKISIFDQIFDLFPKLIFLTKNSIFDQNFDLWQTFRFLTKIFNLPWTEELIETFLHFNSK